MRYSNNVKKVGILGIIGNIFLFTIKIFVGISSKSQSMMADAFNSAGDFFSSVMTWIGGKISSVPNDKTHNYGHGKVEYIFSMLISISMIVLSLKMLYDSIVSIFSKSKLVFSWWLIIVCLITIIIKVVLYLHAKKIYKKSKNILVKANMIDYRNDSIITVFTTIAIFFSKYNIYVFDGIVGTGISLWIFIVGLRIFLESYNVLMDTSIDSESRKIVLSIIKSHDEIKRIGTLYSIPIGYQYIAVITVYIDGNMSTTDSHQISEELEERITKEIDKIEKVIIHVEPFNNVK